MIPFPIEYSRLAGSVVTPLASQVESLVPLKFIR
jgi:hypothetical protein